MEKLRLRTKFESLTYIFKPKLTYPALKENKIQVYIRVGEILILKNKTFLDVDLLLKIFTLEPNLCLKVNDGNLGDMLT